MIPLYKDARIVLVLEEKNILAIGCNMNSDPAGNLHVKMCLDGCPPLSD